MLTLILVALQSVSPPDIQLDVGGVANTAVGTVGGVAGSLLQNGQLLDLARSGLTEVGRTVNSAGQTVRRVRDRNGQLIEVVTDAANRILSSRRISQ